MWLHEHECIVGKPYGEDSEIRWDMVALVEVVKQVYTSLGVEVVSTCGKHM